jgi:uncharacterized protein (DUF362 family)
MEFPKLTRRDFLIRTALGSLAAWHGMSWLGCSKPLPITETFIAKIRDYSSEIGSTILSGFKELKISKPEIQGKRILLKPNLVESHTGAVHVTTHPMVIRGAIEAFLRMGADRVIVGEGSGHCRDTLRVIEETGLVDVLSEERSSFIDLNQDDLYTVVNSSKSSRLKTLTLPITLRQTDWIVSMPKMKTHHWVGITLSMKNLFGVMPGIVYGWPKNVLHCAGIDGCIVDINVAVKPHLAIVDGIVGMQGDGPIMGTPKYAGLLVMGRNLPAVDGTCVRVMGYDPKNLSYLRDASRKIGPIIENRIIQRGETIKSVTTKFELEKNIPAHKKLLG